MAKHRPISQQQMPQHREPTASSKSPKSLIADPDKKTKEEQAAEDSTTVDPDTTIGDRHLGSGIHPGQAESDAAAALHAPIAAQSPNLQALPDEQALSLDADAAAHVGNGQPSDAEVLAGLLPDGPANGDGTQSSAGDGGGGGAGHSPSSSGGLGSSLGLGPEQPNPFGPGDSGGAAHVGKPGSDIGAVAEGIHGRVVYESTFDDGRTSVTTYADGTVEEINQTAGEGGPSYVNTTFVNGTSTMDVYDGNGDLISTQVVDESGAITYLDPDGTIRIIDETSDTVLNPDGTGTQTRQIEGQGQDPDQDGGSGQGAEIGRALHSDLRGVAHIDHSGDDVDFGQGDTGQAEIVGGPISDAKGTLLGGDGRADFDVGGLRNDGDTPPDGAPAHSSDAINTGDDHVDAPGGGIGLEDDPLGGDTGTLEDDPDDGTGDSDSPIVFDTDLHADLTIHDVEPDEL